MGAESKITAAASGQAHQDGRTSADVEAAQAAASKGKHLRRRLTLQHSQFCWCHSTEEGRNGS